MNNDHKYDDIINLPHHISKTRPHMPLTDRAAQFSSFAALSGYKEAIRETERITDEMIELSEYAKEILCEKLIKLKNSINIYPEIEITYFTPDSKKAGGFYNKIKGKAKKYDEYNRNIVLDNGAVVPFDCIYDISGELFDIN